MSKKVISYQLAYLNDIEVSLCRKHNTSAHADAPLGPVSHGLHRGECLVCDGYAVGDKGQRVRRPDATLARIASEEPAIGEIFGK